MRLCDCGLERVEDGQDVGFNCRVELELTTGRYCLAYRERQISAECEQMWMELETPEPDPVIENFTPAQGSCERAPFRQPVRKHGPNRRFGGA